MVYQDRIDTNLLQLFAHPETTEWFSIISGIIFESTSLLNRNKYNWLRFCLFFIRLHCPQLFYCPSLPYCCSVIPGCCHKAPSKHYLKNTLWMIFGIDSDWVTISGMLHNVPIIYWDGVQA